MTTADLIKYYADLLILQYIGKPKAYATIEAQVEPVIMDQLPTQVQAAFNLMGGATAVGVQLDTLGKYAGVARTGNGFYGVLTLNDVDFLSLVKMAIVQNSSGSSLAQIQANLLAFFGVGGILVFDFKTMRMSYLVSHSVGSVDLVQLFITEQLLPKPMAVNTGLVIYAPVINTFFGFRTYTLPAVNSSPFNDYAAYQMDYPWLSYALAVYA